MRDVPSYDPASLEAKWQTHWADHHTNEPDLDRAPRPFYNLMMFPYPSAEGLHIGTHPAKLIPQIITTFRRQLRGFGVMFDWRHELSTTDPSYYKWTQWLFLQLFKADRKSVV